MTILRKSVSLNPGESKPVVFQFTPSEVKAYSVLVDGLSGSFIASESIPTTRLFGRVTDRDSGVPIVSVYGTVYQDKGMKTWDYDFTTNAQGYYEITDMIPDADLTQMVIYADGYKTYTKESIPISEGDNQLNVRMRRG